MHHHIKHATNAVKSIDHELLPHRRAKSMHVTKAASVVNDDDTRLASNPVEAAYSLIVLRILRWILVADHPHYSG